MIHFVSLLSTALIFRLEGCQCQPEQGKLLLFQPSHQNTGILKEELMLGEALIYQKLLENYFKNLCGKFGIFWRPFDNMEFAFRK